VQAAAFSADARFAACAESPMSGNLPKDQVLSLWDRLPPAESQDVAIAETPILSVNFLHGGPLALTCSTAAIGLWDLPTGQKLDLPAGPFGSIEGALLSADGRTLAIHHDADQLTIFDAADSPWQARATMTVARQSSLPILTAMSPDGSAFLTPGPDGSLSLRSAAGGRELCRLTVRQPDSAGAGVLTSAVISPDGRHALTAGQDHAVRFWDLSSGREILSALRGHLDDVKALAFTPDGRTAFSAGGDRDGANDYSIRQWDLATGRQTASLVEHEGPVRALAVHPDGTVLVSASDDKTICLWNIANGHRLWKFEEHDFTPVSLAFSPDGQRLLIAGDDGLIRLWDFTAPGRREAVEKNPALLFSLCGLDDWAIDQMARDQSENRPISFLELARSHWRLGHLDDAMVNMNLARRQGEAPDGYISLCLKQLQMQRNAKTP
jgi:WD40 repeat protein